MPTREELASRLREQARRSAFNPQSRLNPDIGKAVKKAASSVGRAAKGIGGPLAGGASRAGGALVAGARVAGPAAIPLAGIVGGARAAASTPQGLREQIGEVVPGRAATAAGRTAQASARGGLAALQNTGNFLTFGQAENLGSALGRGAASLIHGTPFARPRNTTPTVGGTEVFAPTGAPPTQRTESGPLSESALADYARQQYAYDARPETQGLYASLGGAQTGIPQPQTEVLRGLSSSAEGGSPYAPGPNGYLGPTATAADYAAQSAISNFNLARHYGIPDEIAVRMFGIADTGQQQQGAAERAQLGAGAQIDAAGIQAAASRFGADKTLEAAMYKADAPTFSAKSIEDPGGLGERLVGFQSGGRPVDLSQYGGIMQGGIFSPATNTIGQIGAEGQQLYSQEDLAFTARQNRITVEEVKRRLGIQ